VEQVQRKFTKRLTGCSINRATVTGLSDYLNINNSCNK